MMTRIQQLNKISTESATYSLDTVWKFWVAHDMYTTKTAEEKNLMPKMICGMQKRQIWDFRFKIENDDEITERGKTEIQLRKKTVF